MTLSQHISIGLLVTAALVQTWLNRVPTAATAGAGAALDRAA
jgi:hypothetical protein